MSVRGKWRVVQTPEHDMAGPNSYFLFVEAGGEFPLDCLTGSIHGHCEGNAVEFTWSGSDEMDSANGHGWAEKQDDGTLEGEICLEGGDDISFIARRLATSSTAASPDTIFVPVAPGLHQNWNIPAIQRPSNGPNV